MALFILCVILAGALVLIPLGLPGTWVMVAAALGYRLLLPLGGIGVATVVGIAIVALGAELLELSLAAGYTRKYGGSRRAGWGAILGGLVGAFVGVPVPLVGPIIGAFAGAFAGALVGELSMGTGHRVAARVAKGALLGRVAGAAMKVATGAAMAAWIVIAALT